MTRCLHGSPLENCYDCLLEQATRERDEERALLREVEWSGECGDCLLCGHYPPGTRGVDDHALGHEWAMENKKDAGEPVAYADIKSYLRHEVSCPSGGTSFDDSYVLPGVDVTPTCKRQPTHKLD